MFSITLQSTDNQIVANETVGQIQFAASSESDGGAAIAIAGGVYCKAEGSFQSASNPTSIIIATASADASAAVDRVKVSEDGHFLPVTNDTYDIGSESLQFKRMFLAGGLKTPIESNTDGATITFNMDEANTHTVTLGGNRSLALSNVDVGQKFVIRLAQDATGSRTVTWFTTIKWPGGLEPTLTETGLKTDVFGFICTGTNQYDGYVIGYAL